MGSKSLKTKEKILQCALEAFATAPYDAVSVRAIARRADVDPALIHNYFGSKEKLFTTAVSTQADNVYTLEGIEEIPSDQLGYEIVRRVDQAMCSPAAGVLRAIMLRCLSTDPAYGRAIFEQYSLRTLSNVLQGNVDHPQQRAALILSQLSGMIFLRHTLQVEPLANLTIEDVVRRIGGAVQFYLDADFFDELK